MNIFQWINSRDIRKHLEEQEYRFTTSEAAWLAWQCDSLTFSERHAAWQEIIDTMPDCALSQRINCRPQKSLHELLRRYMAMENKYLARFLQDEVGSVYAFESEYQGLPTYGEFCDGRFFSSWELLCKALREEGDCSDSEENTRMGLLPPQTAHSPLWSNYAPQKLLYTHVCKAWPSSPQKIKATFLPDGRLKRLDITGEDDEDTDLLFYSFFGMYFRFPIPFQKGDLVCKYNENSVELPDREFYVLTDGDVLLKQRKSNDFYCDFTDMWVRAHDQGDGGELLEDICIPSGQSTYMDLEYCRTEPQGKRRVFWYLSKYYRGEMDVVEFANAYHVILEDTKLRRFSEYEDVAKENHP